MNTPSVAVWRPSGEVRPSDEENHSAGADEVVDVSVVICAYTFDRWAQLSASVKSLLTQTRLPSQVIVVIDHNPALLEAARSQFAGCIVIENQYERGASGSRNSGLPHALGEILAFIDDDAIPQRDWLERLMGGYSDASVMGVGGKPEADWLVARPDWFPPEFEWVVGCSYVGLPQATATIRNPIGANMSFRRHVFETVGAFNTSVGRQGVNAMGCEETEFAIRASRAMHGFRIVYEPSAVVRHAVPAARATWSYYLRRCWREGRSKALLSTIVGPSAASRAERSYVLRTLPRGMITAVSSAWRSRRPRHLLRIPAILAGLTLTTAGYAAGAAYSLIGSRGPVEGAAPSATSR